VRSDRGVSRRIVTRGRVAAFLVASIALAGTTIFFVHGRHELHSASDGLTVSEHHLAQLHTQLRDAVVRRAEELAALEHARDALRNDTAARDRLRETGRAEYRLLVAALQSLSQHRTELEADAGRAKLLDDCLIGASRVLNEAAVGDTFHLRSTLPAAQRLCTEAAA
jgi:hypothetical protein